MSTNTNYDDSLSLWCWLLDARDEKLFDCEWITQKLLENISQRPVPAFDRMEQKLREGPLVEPTFRQRLDSFLRVWEGKKVGVLCPFSGMAASRMLVRLLRYPKLPPSEANWVREKLDKRLSEYPLWPEEFTPTFSSTTEIASFIEWERAHWLGRHRLLFPVFFDKAEEGIPKGALVAAEVSVVERKQAPEALLKDRSFVLAPWSWFAWENDEPKDRKANERQEERVTFAKVTDDLRKALIKVGKITPDGETGCRLVRADRVSSHGTTDYRPDDRSVVFVIDLQPLSQERDFARSIDKSAAQAEAWSSSSPAFSIGGDSMGLTLAFSAWAATEGLSIHPLIATGKVTNDAKIEDVGGDEEKPKAIERFCERSGLVWWRVFPDTKRWSSSKHIKHDPNHPTWFPRCLKEAFKPDLLTDGFDDYRTALGVQGKSGALGVQGESEPTPLMVELNKNHKCLPPAHAEPPAKPVEESPPDSTGFIVADWKAAEKVRESLEKWLGDPTVRLDLEPLVAPFGKDPQVFPDWLLVELCRSWPHTDNTTLLGTAPVIVPVPLAALIAEDDIPDRMLSDRLASAIESRLKKFGVLAPTPDQVAIALRNTGKLVLLVYPPESMEWWKRLTGGEKKWDKIQGQLHSLENPSNEDRFARQIVVPICSDLHHQYRWFGKPTS